MSFTDERSSAPPAAGPVRATSTDYPCGATAAVVAAERFGPYRLLRVALVYKVIVIVAEVVGSIESHSFAMRADTAHMAIDACAISVALYAARRAAQNPSGPPLGTSRLEHLAVRINGVILLVVGVPILLGAVRELDHPIGHIAIGWEFSMAFVRFAGSMAMARVLTTHARSNLNLRAIELHAWADGLSSLGLIVAAAVIAVSGWTRVDAVLGIVIGAIVIRNGAHLLQRSVHPHVGAH